MWEVRAFTGRDERGRPTQVSRTVRGTKKDALRVAAELTVRPVTRAASATVADLLAQWVEQNEATWAASTRRDNPGRAAASLADPLAKMPISRVSVADVERWHTRMRRAGVGETAVKNRHTVLRAAFTQAVRWGWLTANPVGTARLSYAKRTPRASRSADEVRRVLDAAAGFDPAAALAVHTRDWAVDRRDRWAIDSGTPAIEPLAVEHHDQAPASMRAALRHARLEAERRAVLATIPPDPTPRSPNSTASSPNSARTGPASTPARVSTRQHRPARPPAGPSKPGSSTPMPPGPHHLDRRPPRSRPTTPKPRPRTQPVARGDPGPRPEPSRRHPARPERAPTKPRYRT